MYFFSFLEVRSPPTLLLASTDTEGAVNPRCEPASNLLRSWCEAKRAKRAKRDKLIELTEVDVDTTVIIDYWIIILQPTNT